MTFASVRNLPKNKLHQLVFIVIATVGGLVGITQCYGVKNWSALSETKKRIASVNEQIQQASLKAKESMSDERSIHMMKTFVETQQAAMVSGDPFAWVVRKVSLLAERHPVHVVAMKPGGKDQKDSRAIYTANIEVDGAYDELGEFLQEFENAFPSAEIFSLDVSGGEGERGHRRASIRLAFLMQDDSVGAKVFERPKQDKKTS